MNLYRGKARITKEMMRAILGIPEGVSIGNFEYDIDREVLAVYMDSKEEVEGYTAFKHEANWTLEMDIDVESLPHVKYKQLTNKGESLE